LRARLRPARASASTIVRRPSSASARRTASTL
jgi:hypothetical protein